MLAFLNGLVTNRDGCLRTICSYVYIPFCRCSILRPNYSRFERTITMYAIELVSWLLILSLLIDRSALRMDWNVFYL